MAIIPNMTREHWAQTAAHVVATSLTILFAAVGGVVWIQSSVTEVRMEGQRSRAELLDTLKAANAIQDARIAILETKDKDSKEFRVQVVTELRSLNDKMTALSIALQNKVNKP